MYFDNPQCEYSDANEKSSRYTPPEDFEFRHLVDSTKWIDHADSLGRRKSRQPDEKTFECAYNEDGELISDEGSSNCSRTEWRPTPRRKKEKRPLVPQPSCGVSGDVLPQPVTARAADLPYPANEPELSRG